MKSAEKLVIICFLFEGVLCREFSVSLPESVEALRGLCVLIPCRFEIQERFDKDLQGDPAGLWLKDGISVNNNKVFDSKLTGGNKIAGKLIGNLLMKNCTTVFYNISERDRGEYYFRLEASGSLKLTYNYPSVSMRVRVSPISPSVTLYKEDQGEVEDQNEVLEGTSVSLICSAPAPCPFNLPTFTWNFLPEERRQEQNHSTSFSSSQLNFTATHLHHGLDFTCTATYQLQNNTTTSAQSSRTLRVLYGPRNTTVSASPAASVLLGSSVSLSCSSDGNPAVLIYTWYRENGEQIGTGNRLTINSTDSTHRGLYYCRAQNQHGEQNSSVEMDVQYAPQLSPSSSCNITQDLIMCSCEVHGNPPPKLEWRLSGQTVQSSDAMPIQVESVSNTSLRKSILFSIPQSVKDTPPLQCVGSNNLGIASQVFFFTAKSQCHAEGSGVDVSSVLIGAAAGASVMMMLCGIFLCVRKTQSKPPSGQEDTSGILVNDKRAVCQDEGEESVYENKMESLHYSTVMFPNGSGSEIRGLSKLTADYATVRHGSEKQTEGGVTETAIKEVQKENGPKTNSEKVQEAEVTYGNITRRPKMEQTQFELVNDDNNDDFNDDNNKTKYTKEAKERDKEQHKHSEEAEGLYAQVKPNKHEKKS